MSDRHASVNRVPHPGYDVTMGQEPLKDKPWPSDATRNRAAKLHEIEDAYFNGRKEAVTDGDHAIRRLLRPDEGRRNGTYNDGLRDALWALAGILKDD